MIEFKHSSAPIVESDLEEVEQRFGFQFPPEFREFYLRVNGGRPNADRLIVDGEMFIVHKILPVKYGKPGLRLEDDIEQVKFNQALLPEHLIPFAINPGGDYFCFSTCERDKGSICIFRMDYFDDPFRAVIQLTPSLAQFLSRLTFKNDQNPDRGMATRNRN